MVETKEAGWDVSRVEARALPASEVETARHSIRGAVPGRRRSRLQVENELGLEALKIFRLDLLQRLDLGHCLENLRKKLERREQRIYLTHLLPDLRSRHIFSATVDSLMIILTRLLSRGEDVRVPLDDGGVGLK